VTVEQSWYSYGPAPSQQPSAINNRPITKIAMSTTNQSGARFGEPPLMSASCLAVTATVLSQLTNAHRRTADQRSAKGAAASPKTANAPHPAKGGPASAGGV
jgi:hypothetical protein